MDDEKQHHRLESFFNRTAPELLERLEFYEDKDRAAVRALRRGGGDPVGAQAPGGPAQRRLPDDRLRRGHDGHRRQLRLVHRPRQGREARGHDHQDQPGGGRGGRAPAAASRHRRDHRHRLHRHGPRPQPRHRAEDAAQVARRGPHQDLRGRDLPARAGGDDAPERDRRRARDPHQDLPDLRGRGRGALRGDRGPGGRPLAAGPGLRAAAAAGLPDPRAPQRGRAAGRACRERRARSSRSRQETGKHFHFEGTEALPIDHFEVVLEGTREEVEERALPFREGEEVLVQIEEPHMYNDDDAVAKLDGYIVSVFGAASLVGERTLVRIEKVGRSAAQASLVDPPAGIVAAPAEETESSKRAPAPARPPRRPRPAQEDGGRVGVGAAPGRGSDDPARRRGQRLAGPDRHELALGEGRHPRAALDGARREPRSRSRSAFSRGCRARAESASATRRSTASSAPPARRPSLTIADLDRAIAEVQSTTGSGSAARRKRDSRRAPRPGHRARRRTSCERLFTGDCGRARWPGLMVDAIAKAAGVSGRLARRALMLSGDLTRTAEIAIGEGEDGLRAVGLRDLPAGLSDARLDGGERGGGGRELRACVGGVEARRDPDPDPSPRRRDPDLHPQPQRDHADRCPGSSPRCVSWPSPGRCSTARRCGWTIEGPAAFQDTVSQIDGDAPPEGIVTFLFDLLHVDGEDLLDTPLAGARPRGSKRSRRELKIPSVITSDARDGTSVCSTRRCAPGTRASS